MSGSNITRRSILYMYNRMHAPDMVSSAMYRYNADASIHGRLTEDHLAKCAASKMQRSTLAELCHQ